MRKRTMLTVGAGLAAIAAAAWFGPGLLGAPTGPEPVTITRQTTSSRSEALARTRLGGEVAALDTFVTDQGEECARRPDDPDAFRVLAEAHLERCLLRDSHKGMAVGETTHDELPDANAEDLEAGMAAADRAVELGDPTADVHRIRSALMSLRITGFASALATRPAVDAALRRAEEIDPGHPRVVIARACEKLFAPNSFLGHDPESARRMFLLAAEALPLDERPHMFASMCAWLLERPDEAIGLMEQAVERNPRSVYTTEVLRRLNAGEDGPFARDVGR